jgi:hypothetical protein
MRYYKQHLKWKYAYVLVLLLGAACVFWAFFQLGFDSGITLLPFGFVCLIAGWVLKRGHSHFIEIDDENIIHRGFRNWTIRRSDVTRVERGRKGWMNEKELYLKIFADKEVFDVDDGFLKDEDHAQELAKAMGSR